MSKIFIDTSRSYLLPGAGFDEKKRVLEYKKKLNDYGFFSIFSNPPGNITHINNILSKFDNADEKKDGVIYSGTIPVNNLCNEIEAALNNVQDKIFAVVSNNSAHHFSYPLSNIAFSRHGNNGNKKIIINFDQHEDKGKLKAEDVKKNDAQIACSAWGQFSLHRKRNNVVVDEYMVVGYGVKGSAKNTIFKSIGSENVTKDKIIDKIKGYNTNQYDVYITVDRDFSQDGFTKYNYGRDLEYTQAQGRDLVTKAIENLSGANIVGFDITGLPALENNTPGYKTNKDAFKTALEDIDMFQKKMEQALS